jgi:hypothetical protein
MGFDLDRYLGHVGPLDDADIDYEEFVRRPLAPDVLRCVRYAHDIEHHTICYLRDLLVMRVHDDPEVTSFLSMWAFEEFWHGQALAKVLAMHDEVNGADRIAQTRRRVGAGNLRTALGMLASRASRHVDALALTWGAVNESATQASYLLMGNRAHHPTFTELVRRIARQEGLHIDFYLLQAGRRLDAPSAQRLVRSALQRWWRPVGASLMPAQETTHVVRFLFGGDDGREMTRRVDRRIARLPGLDGLTVVESTRRRYAAVA